MDVSGKVAIVTGGARGLGRGFAEALLKEGAKVALLDILDEAGGETAVELNNRFGADSAYYIHCDVSNIENINKALEEVKSHYGRYHIAVNNAGIGAVEIWSKMIDINLRGLIHLTREAIDHMDRSRGGEGGCVVNIASIAGLAPAPLLEVYCATKHGVVGFTEATAMTLGLIRRHTGVRVACLCPGFAATPLVAHLKQMLKENKMGAAFPSVMNDNLLTVEQVSDAFMELIHSEAQGNVMSYNVEQGKSVVWSLEKGRQSYSRATRKQAKL